MQCTLIHSVNTQKPFLNQFIQKNTCEIFNPQKNRIKNFNPTEQIFEKVKKINPDSLVNEEGTLIYKHTVRLKLISILLLSLTLDMVKSDLDRPNMPVIRLLI